MGQPTTPPSGDDLAVLNYHRKRPAATLAFPLLCNCIVLPIPLSTSPIWFYSSKLGSVHPCPGKPSTILPHPGVIQV